MSLREEKPCNLCGSAESTLVYSYEAGTYDHARFETASWDGRQHLALRIVRCSSCGLVFSSPAFRENGLDYVYPEDLIPKGQTFASALRTTARKHRGLLRSVSRYLSSGVLCDVGTRYGCLPYIARQAGYAAFGIEYNARSVEVGRAEGVPIFRGTCADIEKILPQVPCDHIDAFVLDDVLEHLTDPRRDLMHIAATQDAGGLVFARQMDLNSLGHRLYGRNWYYLQPAAHMYYFDESSVRRLFKLAGYRVRAIHRPSLLRNATLTAAWRGKQTIHGRLRRVRSAGDSEPPGKKSYLSERRKSYDDMFLVVAEKV